MNALQSLKTSGVHAKRCSSVPCEKEGAGQAIADSNASDTRHFLKGVNRSRIHLFRLSRFIGAPAIGIEVVTHRSGYDTLLLQLVLVAGRQRL